MGRSQGEVSGGGLRRWIQEEVSGGGLRGRSQGEVSGEGLRGRYQGEAHSRTYINIMTLVTNELQLVCRFSITYRHFSKYQNCKHN